ncbi:hypothetical protein PUR28_06680, partial [Streptomyces sp. BE308]|nr:hypothetical protein [Streptomyces sp. BE308]
MGGCDSRAEFEGVQSGQAGIVRICGKVRQRPSASWREGSEREFSLIGVGRYEVGGALAPGRVGARARAGPPARVAGRPRPLPARARVVGGQPGDPARMPVRGVS